jgi:hypothetical protein
MTSIAALIESGLALVPIPLGKKRPIRHGWNRRENVITSAADARRLTDMNVGLAHAYSTPTPTCALDIDNYKAAKVWLAAEAIDIEALLKAGDAAVVWSGKRQSIKVIYRLPIGAQPVPTKTVHGGDGSMILEFRCSTSGGMTVQDVLPPSLHPAGTHYEWVGNGDPLAISTVPPALLDLWCRLNAQAEKYMPPMLAHLISAPTPELPIHIDRVKAQLACVSPDCTYERWRDVVWSVLSTRWECAMDIAREWSACAPQRFDERAFEQLCRHFDPSKGITLGTLVHHAKGGGWQPDSATPAAAVVQLKGGEERSRLLTRQDLQSQPPMQWRIRGVLPARGLAAVYGPSGSGKTFLALDLACSVACALPLWFGAKVKPAPVAYVALEGEAGIRSRLAAWETQNGRQVPNAARFVLGGLTLLKPTDAEQLAADILAQIGKGAVVVIDTLNQSAPGADENASTDMGRVIANAKALADAVEGVVVLVHHAGKDASRGMRGHSSLFAAMDAVIEVASSPSGRTWRLSKSKEGESGEWRGFELVSHAVGRDEDGADIRSCAVWPALPGTVKPGKPVKPVTGKNRTAALPVLAALAASHPEGIPFIEAVAEVGAALTCPSARRHGRAVEAIKGLTEAGHLQQDDEGSIVLS